MTQIDVAVPMVVNSIKRRPRTIVFEISTPRKPTRCRIFGIRNFVLMAAIACGMMSRPDCTGVKPKPTW